MKIVKPEGGKEYRRKKASDYFVWNLIAGVSFGLKQYFHEKNNIIFCVHPCLISSLKYRGKLIHTQDMYIYERQREKRRGTKRRETNQNFRDKEKMKTIHTIRGVTVLFDNFPEIIIAVLDLKKPDFVCSGFVVFLYFCSEIHHKYISIHSLSSVKKLCFHSNLCVTAIQTPVD